MMYAITYVLVPGVAGILAVRGRIGFPPRSVGARAVASLPGVVGALLLGSAILNAIDFIQVMRALNPAGWLLFGTILSTQIGLGILGILACLASAASHPRVRDSASLQPALVRAERWLGATAVATALAMALVRGQIFISIF